MPKKLSAYLLINEQDSQFRFRATRFAQERGYVPVYPTIMGDFFDIKQNPRKAKDNRITLIRKSHEIWVFGDLSASMWDLVNYSISIGKKIRHFSIKSGKIIESKKK